MQAQTARAAGDHDDLALQGEERREIIENCLGHGEYWVLGVCM